MSMKTYAILARSRRRLAWGSLLLALCASAGLRADPPLPYRLAYDAHYGAFRAQSERSLEYDADRKAWHLQALSYVKLFGKDLTRITEDATFGWRDNLPVPMNYSFVQKGIGKRSRSVTFDPDGAGAHYQVNDDSGELSLDGPVYDDLSAFLVIRAQLQQGLEEINYDAVDKSEVKHYLYRVVDRPQLKTEVGTHATVHIERVRDEDSQRTTEFWLVPELDYLLVKMLQVEPNGREIRLDIRSAELDGKTL